MIGEERKNRHAVTFSWMYRDDTQKVSEAITQVYLELTTVCNLSCRSCVRFSIDGFKTVHMETALFEKIIAQLRSLDSLKRIVLLGFGEALCHPEISAMLTRLRTLTAEIVLVTNASFLSEELTDLLCRLPLDRVVTSWDDAPAGTGRIIRRGKNLSASAQNLARLADTAAKNKRPAVGMQMVAMKSNAKKLEEIIRFGEKTGVDHFLVSNIFPYSEAMKNEILYAPPALRKNSLKYRLKKLRRRLDIEVASTETDRPRKCPFIERGTLFVTVEGEIAPCPELAYTHRAWYYGAPRIHNRQIFGSVKTKSLRTIWMDKSFSSFRESFAYWDLPDCSSCEAQGDCSHRLSGTDCYWNPVPCGECLWAKNIVICP